MFSFSLLETSEGVMGADQPAYRYHQKIKLYAANWASPMDEWCDFVADEARNSMRNAPPA